MALAMRTPMLLAALAALALIVLVFLQSQEASAPSAPTPAGPAATAAATGAPRGADELADPSSARPSSAGASERTELTAAAAAPPPRADAPERRARGRLVDELGRAVSGAEITVAARRFLMDWRPDPGAHAAGARATSDASGAFELTLPAGLSPQLELVARARGFARLERDVRVAEPEQDLGTLVLDRGVILAGVVLDSAGQPVAGAELRAEPRSRDGLVVIGRALGRAVATSDAQGRFEVADQAVGPWTFQVTHEAHPDGWFDGETKSADDHQTELVFSLADGAEIEGIVSGLPAEGARGVSVEAWPAEAGRILHIEVEAGDPQRQMPRPRVAEVASDGRFRVRGLESGRQVRLQAVRARAAQAAVEGIGFDDQETVSEPVLAAAGARGVELAWSLSGAIELQVVDAGSGAPIEDLGVRYGSQFLLPLRDAEAGGFGPRTHFPEGRVRIGDLRSEPGDEPLRLELSAAGYEPCLRSSIEVAPGRTVDLGVISLARVPVLEVVVRDDATGAPIEGASIELRRATSSEGVRHAVRLGAGGGDEDEERGPAMPGEAGAHRATTDGAGRARVSSLPGQAGEVLVRADGFAPYKSAALDLPATGDARHEARLVQGARATITVLDRAGAPVAGRTVEHQGALGDMLMTFGDPARDTRVRSNEAGLATFPHLEPGRHWFRLDERSALGMGMVFASSTDGGKPMGEGWVELDVASGGSYELELRLAARGTLEGRVTEGGEALAGAELVLQKPGEDPFGMMGGKVEARTSSTGRYLLEDAREGEYRLEVRHPTRALPASFPVTVREGENQLDLDLAINFLRGQVVDLEGKPVAGATVRAVRAQPAGGGVRMSMVMVRSGGGPGSVTVSTEPGAEDVETTTDEEGRYVLRGIPSGIEVQVEARAKGFQKERTESIQLDPDEDRDDFDLALTPGGSLRISVEPADQYPTQLMAVASYRGEGSGPGTPEVAVLEAGEALLEDLQAGPWEVQLRPMGPAPEGADELPAAQSVTVVGGEEVSCRFDL